MKRKFPASIAALAIFFAVELSTVAEANDANSTRLESGAILLAGRAVYQERCASCHGPKGQGTGTIAVDFSEPAALIRLDTETILTVIERGNPTHPQTALADDESRAVVAYLREHLMLPAPEGDASLGRTIYSRSCSVCHGDKGDAASWAKTSLDPPPVNFTVHSSESLSREDMVEAVTFGSPGTAMVSFATQLRRAEIAATVDYIRATFMTGVPKSIEGADADSADFGAAIRSDPLSGGLVGNPVWGRAFFKANCAECHGTDGKGDGPRAYFMIRKPTDLTTPLAQARFSRPRLYDAIANGVRGAPMPAWDKVLNPQQIANVTEYVYRAFFHTAEFSDTNDASSPQPIWQRRESEKKN